MSSELTLRLKNKKEAELLFKKFVDSFPTINSVREVAIAKDKFGCCEDDEMVIYIRHQFRTHCDFSATIKVILDCRLPPSANMTESKKIRDFVLSKLLERLSECEYVASFNPDYIRYEYLQKYRFTKEILTILFTYWVTLREWPIIKKIGKEVKSEQKKTND